MIFKHYILTRYNVGLYTTNPYKVENKDEWMEHRLPYFERCADSLSSQTCQKFEWLIFVDPMTPSKYINQIRRASHSTIVPMLPLPYLKQRGVWQPWLMTTRLDCDDYLENEFVNTIQSAFQSKKEVLDVMGLQWIESSVKWSETGRKKPNSPFITLVEPSKNFKTVLDKTHSILYYEIGGRIVGDEPLYVQVIHDRNIMNKPSGLWL